MAVLRLVPSQGAPTPLEISRDSVVVGREPTCDVVVSDGSVSRKHAIVERRGSDWAIVDQGSANGTFVDSQRVTEMVLRNGQELRFGSMAFRVQIEGDDTGATILTGIPEATMVQDSPMKKPPAAPVVKPATPPWSGPPGAPLVTAAPPLPKEPAPALPPAVPRPAAPPLPVPPRAAAPPAASAPPPIPPRPTGSRPPVVTPVTDAGSPPPVKKARGPLFWAGGGCCGCLVLVLVFLGVIGGGAYFMTSGAVEAARAQIADIKKGDLPAAYGRMTPEYRAQHTLEDFTAFVDKHPALKQNTDSTFLSRNVKNDTATLAGTLSGADATKEVVTYTLVKDGSAWRIGSISFLDGSTDDAGAGSTALPDTPGGGSGTLHVETVSAEKSESPPGYAIAIKVRATGFGTDGPADAPRTDLVLDLETLGPGGRRLPDLSRMELQSRDHPDALSPPSVDFDVNVTLRDASPGNYVARLTVRDQIGRDIKTHDVPFTLP